MEMKKMRFYLVAALLISTFSCTRDFDSIDTDPNAFTSASAGSVFNHIIQSLLPTWNEMFYLDHEILYKQTQQAALTQSAWGNFTIATEDIWKDYYTTLAHIRYLEDNFAKQEQTPATKNMEAMVSIVKAYKTFKVTDIFGDIPYSDAGYGYQDLEHLQPKYDQQREIYLSLLDELKSANEQIDITVKNEPMLTFSLFDKLFNGDLLMWKKFANSLRLRYAMRIYSKEPTIAAETIGAIINENQPVLTGYNFTQSVLESACLWPASNGFKFSSLSWSFREHRNLRMGTNIWHQLSENDQPNGTGIFDPRAYIFFEGDQQELWKPYPQIPDASTPASTGAPYEGYRDDVAYFSLKNQLNYSPFNYFMIASEGTMPAILMTSAEVHFIKAEAYLRGIGVTQSHDNADIEYMNGINTSVEWWTKVANMQQLPVSGLKFQEKITIPATTSVFGVLNHFGSWNATDDQQFLSYIYTQRWIDAMFQPQLAFAEARRVNLLPREGAPLSYYRLPYPPSEVAYNAANMNAAVQAQGGDESGIKMWWQN